MVEIFQYLLNGLTIGGIYALVGARLLHDVGGLQGGELHAWRRLHGGRRHGGGAGRRCGIPLLLAAALAMLVAAALGALIERFLVRPFNTEPNAIGWMLTTIAIGIMLESGATQTYGSLGRPLPSPLAVTPIRIGGAGIYLQELLLPVAAIAVMFGLEVVLQAHHARPRDARRRVQPHRRRTDGDQPRRMALIAFAMAAAIGALAGILISPVVPALPTMGAVIGLKAFMVAIVAGIANARGVVVVGIAFGVIEKLIEGYISTGARDSIGFTLMILVLLAFPQGIFGRREVAKV